MSGPSVVPNRIKVLRTAQKLTQDEVARLCESSFSLMSKIEGGTRELTPAMIEKLCSCFKIPAWQLFLDPDDMPAITEEEEPS